MWVEWDKCIRNTLAETRTKETQARHVTEMAILRPGGKFFVMKKFSCLDFEVHGDGRLAILICTVQSVLNIALTDGICRFMRSRN